MKSKMSLCGMVLMVTILSAAVLRAVEPAGEEMAQRDQWVAAKFEGKQPEIPAQPGLIVLANYGPVQQNGRDGQPLRIADQQFQRGLYCHANSSVVVRLPGPAKSFAAQVGIDTNGQYGGGSIIFIVQSGGKELYRSPVMRRGQKARSVEVDLKNAAEFSLIVNDSGDNINSDQASWADARVTLADGKEIWLGDMKIVDASKIPYDSQMPFSFVFGGQSSRDLMKDWEPKRDTKKLDEFRTQYTLFYTDAQTGLEVRCVGVAFNDFPTAEWTVYLKNIAAQDSPIIENLQALDTQFSCGSKGQFVLHHNRGDDCTVNSFAVLKTELAPQTILKFASVNGRPTNFEWPYYNLNAGGDGIMMAIGWPGQWASQFIRDEALNLRVLGGQELTHFKLRPGEEVRTPLIALLFYQGDWIRGQNLWRQWMLDHNFPKDYGKRITPKLAGVSGHHFPGLMCNQKEEILFIDRFLEEGIKLDYWWMDAGWYVCDPAVGWPQVGTWEVDPKRYPDGIRAISDHAHAKDIQTIVWFEPERVSGGTWITQNCPEWVFGGAGGGLFRLDEPDAVRWITDKVDQIITEQKIDLYRQDYNIDPLSFWRNNDTEDRQGITEIRYVEGYLAYWDELQRRHPGMMIDSCASGGRRDDLETMRRALPLLQSDCEFNPVVHQCHTYGFDLWLPFHSRGAVRTAPECNSYQMHGCIASPMMSFCMDMRKKDYDYEMIRKYVKMWREVSPYYLGDFYPLTPYTTANDVWMVWQFDRSSDLSGGMVHAHRRGDCYFRSADFALQGLDPAARYQITNLETGQTVKVTGSDLMSKGLRIDIDEKPGAVIIKYEKIK